MNVHVPSTQTGRLIAIDTVLGTDALLLERLEVHEGLSQLFTIRATVRAQTEGVRADAIVGTSADVRVTRSDGATRIWNGLVTELHEGPILARGDRRYALTLRPRLWLMSQRSDCRIFLDRTTPQVVETLCDEHGITAFDLSGVTGRPTTQPYAVQWNETDLAYMLRRIEEDGLFYFFAHAEGQHSFVVGDHAFAYRDGDPSRVRIAFGSADGEHIHDWRRHLVFTPGKRAGGDWEFTTPNTRLQASTPSLVKVPGNVAYELYEYPARFLSPEAGETATKLRVQATETDFDRVEGRSSVRTLAAGHRFTPYEVAHPDHVYEAQVVTAILHRAEDPTYETGAGTPHYENEFEVMPAKIPATPHRTTPRPRIDGLQIAKIAGPADEEIHTDAFGRVKLAFPWDRRAKGDGTDTGWVRVSQPWAGGTWGQQVIPRVGMECLVAFQEGDPDRPIVVGLVPNPNTPVPYKLPDNKTRMVFRSNSYRSAGFNEMTFEDRTGAENMFFHAQKDHTTRIGNNQTHSVGANHSNVVGQSQALTVGSNKTEEVGGSLNLTVGATGAGAATLMLPFAGMAGVTTTILGEALQTSGVQTSNARTGADAVQGMESSVEAQFATIIAALAGHTGSMMPPLARSLLGLLSQAGQQAQRNVWNGPSPRPDAGTKLAEAGAVFGEAASALFKLPGMHNHITGTMRADHSGCARIEQVGTSKVTHVGSTYGTRVGKAYALLVGQDAKTAVGNTWSVAAKTAAVIQAGETIALASGHKIVASAGETLTLDAGQAIGAKSGETIVMETKAIGLKGSESIALESKTITLRASEGIQLSVGGNTITIDKNGNIASKATSQVSLEAGGSSLAVVPGQVLSNPMPTDGSPKDTGGFFAPDPNDAHPQSYVAGTGPLRPNKMGDIFAIGGKWLGQLSPWQSSKAGDLGGLAGKWLGENMTKQLNTGYETFKHMFTPGAVQTLDPNEPEPTDSQIVN